MRQSPLSQRLSIVPLVQVLFLVLFGFQMSKPWLRPWLHAHFSDPTASTIGNGTVLLLYAGIIGCSAWFFAGNHSERFRDQRLAQAPMWLRLATVGTALVGLACLVLGVNVDPNYAEVLIAVSIAFAVRNFYIQRP